MFAVQVFAPSEHRATMLQPAPPGVFFRKVHDAAPARARSSPRTIGTALRRSAWLGQASGHQVPTNFSRAGGSGFGSAADAVSTSGCAESERAVSDCPSTGLSGVGVGNVGSAATAAGAAVAAAVDGPAGFGSAGAVAMGAEGDGGSGAGAVEAAVAGSTGFGSAGAIAAGSGAGCGAALLSGTGVAAGAPTSAGAAPFCADTRRFASSDGAATISTSLRSAAGRSVRAHSAATARIGRTQAASTAARRNRLGEGCGFPSAGRAGAAAGGGFGASGRAGASGSTGDARASPSITSGCAVADPAGERSSKRSARPSAHRGDLAPLVGFDRVVLRPF